MTRMERDVWEQIIDIYKEQPHMWDKKSKNYFNRDLRNQTLIVMMDLYKQVEENITLSVFKKKIENMRTTFLREFKKVNASKQTGSGSDGVYKSSLWYYHLFTFITGDSEVSRRGTDTWDDAEFSRRSDSYAEIDTDPQAFRINDSTINETEATPPSRKQQMSLKKKQEQLFDTAQQLLAQKDEWEIIRQSIGLQLKSLSEHQQIIAQKIISDTLYYGKLQKLSEETSVLLRQPPTHSEFASPNFIQQQLSPNSCSPIPFSHHLAHQFPTSSPHQAQFPAPSPQRTEFPYSSRYQSHSTLSLRSYRNNDLSTLPTAIQPSLPKPHTSILRNNNSRYRYE